jgi:uncharacterized protein YndB with AHSA1/START domain
MPVKKDASGRRSVQAEAEVPGTPEEVWRAIASGPGVSAWFVPTTIDERPGGVMTLNFGPGMDAVATITDWHPPHRFTAESRDGMGPNSPTVATEWTVEARAGGTCVVRVVHSWFASTDDWDNQFEGHEHGWAAFFRILRIYLSHFRGQPSAAFQVMAFVPGSTAAAWDALADPLGVLRAAEGERVKSPAGAPSVAGIVERVGPAEYPELLLRLEEPGSGVAHLFVMPMGGQVCVSIRIFLYGGPAAVVAAREERSWQSWMRKRFPSVGPAAIQQESL